VILPKWGRIYNTKSRATGEPCLRSLTMEHKISSLNADDPNYSYLLVISNGSVTAMLNGNSEVNSLAGTHACAQSEG
jgi:hypothetical protein